RPGEGGRRTPRRHRRRHRAQGQDRARVVKLYTYFRSSAAFRVRIALNLKNLKYEPVFVHLAKGEHRAAAFSGINAQARARVRSLSYLVAAEIHPLNNLRVLQHLKRLGQTQEQIDTWYRHWIADGLAKLEADVRDGAGKFCHGDSPTMADCCLVPQIFNAKRFNSDLAPYPTTMRIFDACMKLDAFDRAQPSKQPDAE